MNRVNEGDHPVVRGPTIPDGERIVDYMVLAGYSRLFETVMAVLRIFRRQREVG